MNFKYLKQFLDLSKYTSMSQYAAQNGVTHSQVSRMVVELEKEFGYQLLIRDKSQTMIKLTKKGETLIKRIPCIFREIDHTRTLLEHDQESEKGIFDLVATPYIMDYWISPQLITLRRRYPYLSLDIFGQEQAPTEDDKRTLLTISPQIPENNDFIQVHLKDFHIGLWASPEYIKKNGCPEHISDLSRHILLCFEREWPERVYPTMDWYMNHADFMVRSENIIVIRSAVGIMKAAQTGLGIFALSEENVKMMNMNFERILPHVTSPTVPLCFTYPQIWRNHKNIAIITTFLQNIFKT